MARGGRRPGAGRKPKPSNLRILDGGASHRSKAEAPAEPIETAIDPPDGDVLAAPKHLTEPDAIAVWNELAPLARDARTLTKATTRSLSMLCRLIPLELKLAQLAAGGPEHRGVLQRVNALMLQFNLTPCGKALYEPAKPLEAPKTGLSRFRA
jgi:hypothetical protein